MTDVFTDPKTGQQYLVCDGRGRCHKRIYLSDAIRYLYRKRLGHVYFCSARCQRRYYEQVTHKRASSFLSMVWQRDFEVGFIMIEKKAA